MLTNKSIGAKGKDHWKVGKKLAEGACGEVYDCNPISKYTTNTPYKCVIKACPLIKGKTKKAQKEWETTCNLIYYEYMLSSGVLLDFPYKVPFPPHGYGEDKGHRFLIMQKMDGTLLELCQQKALTGKILAHCGTIILKGLEKLHSKRYLYCDLKPENFMYLNNGSSSSSSSNCLPQIFFIDFAFCTSFTDILSGKHRPMVTGCPVHGTPGYVSLNVQQGNTPSRRDDIEALGYVLLSLAYQGVLPWLTATSAESCLEMKQNANIHQMAKDIGCPQLASFIMCCRSIQYEDCPPYSELYSLLDEISRDVGNKTLSLLSSSSSLSSSVIANDQMKNKRKSSEGAVRKTKLETKTKSNIEEEEAETVVFIDDDDDEESNNGFATIGAKTRPSLRSNRDSNGSTVSIKSIESKFSSDTSETVVARGRDSSIGSVMTSTSKGSMFSSIHGKSRRRSSRLSSDSQSSPVKNKAVTTSSSNSRISGRRSSIESISNSSSISISSRNKLTVDSNRDSVSTTNDNIDDNVSNTVVKKKRNSSIVNECSKETDVIVIDDDDDDDSIDNLQILVASGPHKGETVDITIGDSIKIGRNEDSTLCLDQDLYVSWDHLEVVVNEAGTIRVRDTGSTNSFEIDSIQKKRRRFLPWQKGELLTIGDSTLAII